MRLAVFGGVALALAALGLVYSDFAADDAFILLAFARNLANDGVPSLGGQEVHAVSSLGWFAVAFVAQALPGLDSPVFALRASSGLAALGCVVLTFALVRRLGGSRSSAALAVVLLLFDPWFGRWAFSGMESPAALAVVLAALLLRAMDRPEARLAAPLLVGSIGVLLRPELGLLAVILAIDVARLPDVRALGALRIAGRCLVAAIPLGLGVWLAINLFGELLPRTVEVKRGFVPVSTAASYGLQVIVAGQGIALAVVLAALRGRGGRPSAIRGPLLGVATLWLFALLGFYVLQGYQPLSRYLLPAFGIAPVLAALALDGTPLRLRVVVVIAALVLGLSVTITRARPASQGDGVRVYREIADRLDDMAEPGDVLATWEIGALGWYSDIELLDLGGLVLEAELLPLRSSPRRLLRAERPRFSLLRYEIEGVTFTEVLRRPVRRSAAALGPADVDMVLWELDWPPTPHDP